MDTQGKRLRLLYPDIHGLERGEYLFGDWAAAGMAAFCIGVYPLTHDKEILPVPRTQFDVGLEPQIAFELEFYLLELDEVGGWRPISIPGHRVYGTGMSVDPSGTIGDVVNAALASGFPLEAWCSEYDNAAFEINVRYADAIPAADEAFLFKLLVREICERHGKLATFLGRPFGDRGGSGLHVNFSFRRDDGSNAFHDPNDPDGVSDLAR